ncbi:hypothetical protein HNR25_005180 [Streptomonospora salina]|uniref:Uncharacterized protein n=1 Tax=Streptomonospora salina TaxID=104205 RepID=A0A841EIY2_9ACTN|nr:hypothetical protein [Streptomonospora salina]MBB6001349.1 hypothetical protein [Streptomonospora salina]
MSHSLLTSIDRERLKNLLYGAPATHADLVALAQIAQEAGTDLADLADATGEPGHDPRTGITNPYAVDEPDVLAAEEPDEDALWNPAPREGEDLEDTVTRIGAARDIAAEQAAEIAADLVEVALEMPARARSLARCLCQRGVLAGTASAATAGRSELAEVA